MLSIIGTIIICIVGAWLGLISLFMIHLELTGKYSCTELLTYLFRELSVEEIEYFGIRNLAMFACDICEGHSFDSSYNLFLSKEK